MDLVPVMVDGALVFQIDDSCRSQSNTCESCLQLSILVHNWLKHAELEYAIFDLMDKKEICAVFLEELVLLRKRTKMPILFVGVTERTQAILTSHAQVDAFPFFITPEDAVRALRLSEPERTEATARIPLHLGESLTRVWREELSISLGLI